MDRGVRRAGAAVGQTLALAIHCLPSGSSDLERSSEGELTQGLHARRLAHG